MALVERGIDKAKKLTFLVVDDVTSMRTTIKKMLRLVEIKNVKDAPSADKALEIMKSTKIDFIIADWNMPDLSGIELLHILRDDAETKDLPFLMISGEIEEKQIIRAAESEIDGYIIKPFYTQTLEDKIVSIIERREKPTPFDTHLKVAQVLMDSNQYSKAVAECEEALAINPTSARVRELLGKSYLMMGKLEQGEQMLQEAIDINPMFLRSHETLADHFIKEKKEDQALSLYEKASEISPNNPKRQLSMGHIYLQKNRPDKAQESFKIAQKHTDKAHMNTITTEMGEAYLANGFNQEAVEVFQGVLNNDGKDINAFNKLGIALRKQERYQEAIEQYKLALQVDELDEILHFNVARAYHELGNWAEAKQHIDRCLEIHPTFKEAQEFLKKLG